MATSGKLSFSERIFVSFESMQQAVEERDSRHMTKVMRNLTILRKQMRVEGYNGELISVIDILGKESEILSLCKSYLSGSTSTATITLPTNLAVDECLPEIEGFLGFLIAGHLIDTKRHKEAAALLRKVIDHERAQNRRSLDVLQANALSLLSICHEVLELPDLRAELLQAHRAAVQYHASASAAIYMNLILRAYMQEGLYEAAQKFLDKADFPDSQRASSQHARHLYYVGKLRAIQLEYSDALAKLSLALRKAPPSLSVKIETAKASLRERQEAVKEKIKKHEEEERQRKKSAKREKDKEMRNLTKEEREKREQEDKEKEERVAKARQDRVAQLKATSKEDMDLDAPDAAAAAAAADEEAALDPAVAAQRAADQALLKATSVTATPAGLGFRLSVLKLLIVVELLTGEVPERRLFTEPSEKAALAPYEALVMAVKQGSIEMYKKAVDTHGQTTYLSDGLLSLVRRLRHTVVRSGLRTIATAYSRISLVDVAQRLGYGTNVQDAESVVQKAIADGVIEAKIDHANAVLVSLSSGELYTSKLPQSQLHRRTLFCMQLHDDAVRALIYPETKSAADKDAEEDAKRVAQLEAEARAQAEAGEYDEEDLPEF